MSFQLVALCLAALVAVSAGLNFKEGDLCPEVKASALKCIADAGSTEEEFLKLSEQTEGEIQAENMKCIYHCVIQGMKWLDADGMLVSNPEHLPEKYKNAYNQCRTPEGSDACQKAWNFHKCSLKLIMAN